MLLSAENGVPVLALLCLLSWEACFRAGMIVGLSKEELRVFFQLVVKQTWLWIRSGSNVFGVMSFPDQMLDVLTD